MAELAQLGIQIDTSSLEKLTAALNATTAAAEQLVAAMSRLAEQQANVSTVLTDCTVGGAPLVTTTQ